MTHMYGRKLVLGMYSQLFVLQATPCSFKLVISEQFECSQQSACNFLEL